MAESNGDTTEKFDEDNTDFEPVPNTTPGASVEFSGEDNAENGPPADPSASGNAGEEKDEENEDAGGEQKTGEGVEDMSTDESRAEAGGADANVEETPADEATAESKQPKFDESKFADDERFKSLRTQSLDAKIAASVIALYDAGRQLGGDWGRELS